MYFILPFSLTPGSPTSILDGPWDFFSWRAAVGRLHSWRGKKVLGKLQTRFFLDSHRLFRDLWKIFESDFKGVLLSSAFSFFLLFC